MTAPPPPDGVRFAELDEVRRRGAHLVNAAAAETGHDGMVYWKALAGFRAAGILVLMVVEVEGRLVGHCCAVYGREMWSADCSLTTLSVFVEEQHRGRWGLPLLRAFRAEAERLEAVARVQALPGTRLERMLVALGWRVSAVTYQPQVPKPD